VTLAMVAVFSRSFTMIATKTKTPIMTMMEARIRITTAMEAATPVPALAPAVAAALQLQLPLNKTHKNSVKSKNVINTTKQTIYSLQKSYIRFAIIELAQKEIPGRMPGIFFSTHKPFRKTNLAITLL
jgi:hypothetical protein